MNHPHRRAISISIRIWLVVAMCLGISGTALGVLIHQWKSTTAAYDQTVKDMQNRTREADAARVLQVTYKKEVQEWKDILLRGYKAEDLAKYSRQFAAESDEVKILGSALAAKVTDAQARAELRNFLGAHAELRAGYDAALRRFAGSKGVDAHGADQMVQGKDRAPTDMIDRAVAIMVRRANEAVASERDAVEKKIWAVSLSALLAMAVVALFAAVTVRGLQLKLVRAMTDLRSIVTQLAGASGLVSASSQTLAEGASGQAASLEEASAASEEINSMARSNSENSAAAASVVTASRERIVETTRSLEEAVRAVDDINAQGTKISHIIRTIDEIAFQTNILALNAAVEAARAGQAGMGFGVVADEVRNLAHRCAQAASETTTLIAESVARAAAGKAKMDLVALSIGAVNDESARVKTLVDSMNSASRDEAQAIAQIAEAITRIGQTTQNSAANSEEQAAAAHELSAQSESLRTVVEQLGELIGAARTGAAKQV